jgi:hypothetical protein
MSDYEFIKITVYQKKSKRFMLINLVSNHPAFFLQIFGYNKDLVEVQYFSYFKIPSISKKKKKIN